ncbi:MAG: apolipoprotein N-acyltransferase, partial [Casimicrobiaceae bacterium]
MKYLIASALAAVAGGLTGWLAFAPFGFWPVLLVGLVLLASLVQHSGRFWRGAGLGFAFGLAYFVAGVGWVRVSLHEFGGMPLALAWFSAVLLCTYLALWPALACALAAWIRPRSSLARAVVFAAAWGFTEYLRAHLFTGFEWLGIAQSQAGGGPFAGLLPIVGGFGTAFLLAATASLLASSLTARPRPAGSSMQARLLPLALAAGVLAAAWPASLLEWSRPEGAPVRVSLLQGNVAQSMKWEPEKFQSTLALYERLIGEASGELVILPETALPAPLDRIDPAYLERLRGIAFAKGANLLIGVPLREEGRFYNAVVSMGVEPAQQYRKVHLVPFGEFMPLRTLLGWFYANVTIPMGDFTPGRLDQAPIRVNRQQLGISICYEDAFARDVHRTLPDATLLVNVSNDAWFGLSRAAEQHLQLAQMRAREFARPMLRANNTGVTAVIDARGAVTARLPSWQIGTLEAEVRGHRGYTPYMMWGDLPMLLVFLAVLGIGMMGFPMARRLCEAGCTVSVWNRSRSKAERLLDVGARVTDTPAEAVAACIGRRQAADGVLNAFVALRDEAALQEAQASTRRWQRGEPAGPHAGLPLAVKD